RRDHYTKVPRELQRSVSPIPRPQTDDSDDAEIRILLLATQIVPMIRNASVLGESAVWDNFLKGINSNIFKFCNAESKLEFTYALYARRCGYYGPKGEFLINSTIVRMLSKNEHNLGNELYDTLSELVVDDPERFDDYDETSNLIDLKDFIAFILTPYVAALLIAEDRTIALSDAHDIRDANFQLRYLLDLCVVLPFIIRVVSCIGSRVQIRGNVVLVHLETAHDFDEIWVNIGKGVDRRDFRISLVMDLSGGRSEERHPSMIATDGVSFWRIPLNGAETCTFT
ncbi:hypothetical protein DFH06DRAFT_1423943, partial [Mycena polygramma]